MENLREYFWEIMGGTFVALFIPLIFISGYHSHDVDYYYLETREGVLTITGNVNWSADEHIDLDRSITYKDAIELVIKLNKTLKNK